MYKKLALICIFFLIGSYLFADPLNSRTISNCLSQIKNFTDDYKNYFELYMEIGNVSGLVRDNDQIVINQSNNNMDLQILFRNLVLFRIKISKTSTINDDDGISFQYSDRTGYRTIYRKNYDKGDAWEIEYIFRDIFNSFGF